jgi:hypothetical protein
MHTIIKIAIISGLFLFAIVEMVSISKAESESRFTSIPIDPNIAKVQGCILAFLTTINMNYY